MPGDNMQPYIISNEYNITEILAHFDSDYIISTIEDKLQEINFASSLIQPNIIASFEENFKLMKDQFPGDESNINAVRIRVYTEIIQILCDKFNLQFNTIDDTIDLYTAAFYAYDFLVCNRNSIMVNFFVSFIINNKDSLYSALNLDAVKKNKDSSLMYGKKVYADQKFVLISANIEKAIKYISTLDIRLINIFQSTYVNMEVVSFLDNAFADRGNFFNTYYCSIINKPEDLPIVITNIRLQLQRMVGNINSDSIENIINNSKE